MRIRIKALDTLFFRDGKPFERGDESWADGIFPPPPSVFYGALRSWYIANSKDDVSESLIEESGKIEIKDIYYKIIGEGLYLPLPFDLVEPKYKKDNEEDEREETNREILHKTYQVEKLILKQDESIHSSPFSRILSTKEQKEVEQVSEGLIRIEDFTEYLKGNLDTFLIRKMKDYFISEPKVGIGRDNLTFSVEEGKLYRVDMRRLNDLEMIIDFEQPQSKALLDFSNFIKLGGEGKTTSFTDLTSTKFDRLKIDKETIKLKSPNFFKLYLATPAIFNKGFIPNLEKFGIKANLIGASMGKPLHLGGFDMVKKSPKSMYKVVPAGSVFYYETKENSEKIMDKLQLESICEQSSKEGFGLAYIGNF